MEILSFLAIIGSIFVVTAKSTVLSIIWLVTVFIFSALILAYLGLTYAALTYIIVYVGAIAILFLFVVQLLDQRTVEVSFNSGKRAEVFFFEPLGINNRIHKLRKGGVWPFSIILGILFILSIKPLITQGLPILSFKPLYYLVLGDATLNLKNTFITSDALSSKNITFFPIFTQEGVKDILGPLSSPFSSFLISEGSTKTLSDETYHFFNHQNVEYLFTSKGQVQNLGQWLYGIGSMPLIVTSVILLLAMVGPIMLCWSYL